MAGSKSSRCLILSWQPVLMFHLTSDDPVSLPSSVVSRYIVHDPDLLSNSS